MTALQIQNISGRVCGISLSLEGRISVTKREHLEIPVNVSNSGIHLKGLGGLQSFNTPGQELARYEGKFRLYLRRPDDPSYPRWCYEKSLGDPELRGNSAFRDCTDYIVTSDKGEVVLVFGTDGPLQAVGDGIEARILYHGLVSDDIEGDRRDAHSYWLHTKEMVSVRITAPSRTEAYQAAASAP